MEVERLRALGRTLEAAHMERLVAAEMAPSMGRALAPDSRGGWLDLLQEDVVKLVRMGQEAEAVARCQQAVKRADSSDDQREQARSRRYLGWVLGQFGRHEEAENTLRHAIELAEKADALIEQSQATRSLGWSLAELGRHAEAVDTFRHAIELAEKAGALADEAVATRLLGWSLGTVDRHAEAVDTFRHAIELAEKAGALDEQVQATRGLGWSLAELGRHAEAVDILRHAIALAEQISNVTEVSRAAVALLIVAPEIEDDASLVLAWQCAVSVSALLPEKDKPPDVSIWLNAAVAAALHSGQFSAVWSTTRLLAIKDERHLHRAQDRIAETIAEASLKQGRAAAYALAADWIDVLSRDAAARVSHQGPAGLEPVAFLRGSIPGLAQRVTDPALLRDIAALLEQRLPSETKAERALLEAAARRAESPDDPAALERMDPDVVTALERVLGISPQPDSKPPPRRGKRSGTPRRKK